MGRYSNAVPILSIAAGIFPLLMAALSAKPDVIRPADFQPLTSLPWKAPGATLEGTLDAIYREPDEQVRYAVLGRYLWTIPADELGQAFDLCIARECTDTPDDLVYPFLQIWGARDPAACWKRTEGLFRAVGFDGSWMDYSSWKDRISVPDIDGVRTSPFWIDSSTLTGFLDGVDQSTVSRKERVYYLRAFAEKWLDAFGNWPYPRGDGSGMPLDHKLNDGAAIDAFWLPIGQFAQAGANPPQSRAQVEMEGRRWLLADPMHAPDIIAKMGAAEKQYFKNDAGSPSAATLMVWAKVNLPGMIHWADSHRPSKDPSEDDGVNDVREFLLSRVDSITRARWMAAAKASDPDGGLAEAYLRQWAAWDPKAGIAAAVATGKGWTVSECMSAAVYGPFDTEAMNACQYGMEVARKFDATVIPEDQRADALGNWDEIMEEWGEIDIGDAARYGVNLLKQIDQQHRQQFIQYCSGVDMDDKANDMARRTFDALRVWAVVRPKEMKAWIGALNDPPLQKALTWLLGHPWGGGTS